MNLPTQDQLFDQARQDFHELIDFLRTQSQQQTRLDRVERSLFSLLLALGRTLLKAFIAGAGLGDHGPEMTVGERTLKRSESPHRRWYRSIFGKLAIWRWVYAPGSKKKIEQVPTDARLGLPRGEYSYVLEDWLERLCVKEAYAEGVEGLASLLEIETSVRTAEEHNQQMAEFAEAFRMQQPPPPAEEEESLLVSTSDGASVPMCSEDCSSSPSKESVEGESRSGTTRRAYVGAVYSIAPFPRQPQDVWDELFREAALPRRPRPQGKRLWTEMAETEGGKNHGSARVFVQMAWEVSRRDPERKKTLVCLMDGEKKLWDLQQEWLGRSVQILDFFHVLKRVREVAKLVEPDFHPRREVWVSEQVRDLLEGRVELVLGRWKRLLQRKAKTWSKTNREILEAAIGYFTNNQHRMQYDDYLAKGYPIGSGVAEGACRHLVKDRMNGTGMHWRLTGARAMLKTRALYLNGEWDEFVEYRIQQEQKSLYQTAA